MVSSLSEVVGRDVAHLLTEASAEELRETRNAQLATYALSMVALAAAAAGPLAHEPTSVLAVAGHSLGEYSALAAAGALSAEEGAQLVQARGEAMQEAALANPGTMAAVLGLGLDEVVQACSTVSGAWVANDNAPGQVVVAGTYQGVEGVVQEAQRLGAKRVVALRVGGAFHSPLMASAQASLDRALGQAAFCPTTVPVVTNVDASHHKESFAPLLSAQLCSRVRWRESLAALAGLGATLFVELGPGTELSGMVKRTVPSSARANVGCPDDLPALAKLLSSREPPPAPSRP